MLKLLHQDSQYSVARIVHFLKLKLVGKRISTATALDDANVFGKVGTTGAEVQKALAGRTVRLRASFLFHALTRPGDICW